MASPKLRNETKKEILRYIQEKATSQTSLSELARDAIINKFKSEQFADNDVREIIDELINKDKAVHSHKVKLDVIIPYDRVTNFTREYAPYMTKGTTSIAVISLIITILFISYFGSTPTQSAMTPNTSMINTNSTLTDQKSETAPNYGALYLIGLMLNFLFYSIIYILYEPILRSLKLGIVNNRRINVVIISVLLSLGFTTIIIYSFTFLNHESFTTNHFAAGVTAGAALAAVVIYIFSKDFHVS